MTQQNRTPHIFSVDLDSDAGFRALVDLSPDAVFVTVGGSFVFANAKALELVGATSLRDIQARKVIDFVHPSSRAHTIARTVTLIDERHPIPYAEDLVVRLDGSLVNVESAGVPVQLDGRPAALLVIRDITGRKQAESALHRAEERLRAAFRQAPTPMLVTDSAGVIVTTNPALGRFMAAEHTAFVGRDCFDIVAAEDRDEVRTVWRQLVDGDADSIDGEFRYRRTDGESGWVYARAAQLDEDHGFIIHLTDVTASRLARQRLAKRANLDSLTGLVNRSYVLDRLNALNGTPVAVLFLDLDGFKYVNDRYGHHVGDAVLQVIGKRLRDAVPEPDTVGRLGGDEFAIVVHGQDTLTKARAAAAAAEAAITAPIRVADIQLSIGVSVGIADGSTGTLPPSQLLASADAAMYRAKGTVARSHEPQATVRPASEVCEACAISLISKGVSIR